MTQTFAACLMFVFTTACYRSVPAPSPQPSQMRSSLQIMTSKGIVTFETEIAKTPAQREQGLMRRESLAPERGMLFFFDEDANHSFWMQNTYIPLDLIFFDKNWFVVGIIENLEPLSTKSRSIGIPSRYVLEINSGLIKQQGIVIGNPAVFVQKDNK